MPVKRKEQLQAEDFTKFRIVVIAAALAGFAVGFALAMVVF